MARDRPLSLSALSPHGWDLRSRLDQPEWLDLGLGSEADVQANLAEMWRINRWLGGYRALTQHLYPRLLASPGRSTILDLGTGSADVPLAITRWARRRGPDLQVVAVDWSARNLAVARSRADGTAGVALLRADAGRLPLPSDSVDYVISSLFLHHLAPGQVVESLRAAFAVARRGIIMSDLVRGPLPYLAFKLIQPVFARNALTRHDGALSIRRAYTPGELRELAARAGLPRFAVHAHWPWRMTLVADKFTVEMAA